MANPATSLPMAGTMNMDERMWSKITLTPLFQIPFYHITLHTTLFRVPEFEATQYLVTNCEFLDFVESGGYQNKELWTKEGRYHLCLR